MLRSRRIGKPAQGGVAVAPLAQGDVVADRQVRVSESLGQLAREVQLARARHALVHLLQQDDVGLVVRDDADDPLGTEAPVDPDRAVDVVGEDPQPGHRPPGSTRSGRRESTSAESLGCERR